MIHYNFSTSQLLKNKLKYIRWFNYRSVMILLPAFLMILQQGDFLTGMGSYGKRNHDQKHILLEQIYHQYSRLMYYIAFKVLNDSYLAEDAVQTTFLKLEKNRFHVDSVTSRKTKSFIIIVTRNVAVSILKSKGHAALLCPDDDLNGIPDQNTLPLDVLVKNESIVEIKNAIASLDPKYSDILLLRYFSDYSTLEIASFFDISDELVRVRLHRAKKQLVAKLEERRSLQ